MNNDVNNLVTGLMTLALVLAKGYKANKGVEGYVDATATDPAVLASLKNVITSISALPADFKSLGISDYLSLIPTIYTGVEAVITEVKA